MLPVVVLDTCVLVPFSLRDILLSVAEAGLYDLYWTQEILEELQRTLILDMYIQKEKVQYLLNTIKAFFHSSQVTNYKHLIEIMPNDPKDRHILAAAIACNAQFIVTQNLKHFSRTHLSPLGIAALSPDEFLASLFHAAPERMLQIIEVQAQKMRKPSKNVSQVLDTLNQHAPKFVELLRAEHRYL